MEYRIKMFEKFDMSDHEWEFVKNVDASGGQSASSYEVHNVLSNYYLAKQIEAARKSSDRNSTIMAFLTGAIVLFGLIQILISILRPHCG